MMFLPKKSLLCQFLALFGQHFPKYCLKSKFEGGKKMFLEKCLNMILSNFSIFNSILFFSACHKKKKKKRQFFAIF